MPFTACLTNTQQKQQKTHPTTTHNQGSSRATTKTKDNNHTGCRQMLASTIHMSNTTPTNPTHQHRSRQRRKEAQKNPAHPPLTEQDTGLIPQGPTACQNQPPTHRTPRFHTHHHHPPRGAAAAGSTEEARRARRRRSSMIPLVNTTNASHTDGGCAGRVLLRKEVIQPHLPVRLPCYDFVPIASPTFDGSPHKGWATGFGCCRLS